MIGPWTTALEVATLVRSGGMSAVEVIRATLERIAAGDGRLNSFTIVTGERARRLRERAFEQFRRRFLGRHRVLITRLCERREQFSAQNYRAR